MPSQEFPVSLEVQESWDELAGQIYEGDRSLGAMFDRAQDQVIRLAALYALGDLDTEIRVEHIQAALALWSYCARSAEVILTVPYGRVAPKINPDKVAKIFRFLKERWDAEAGLPEAERGWVTSSEIYSGCLQHNTPARDIKAMLTLDEEQERQVSETISDHLGGRVKFEYRKKKRAGSRGGRPPEEYRLAMAPRA